MKEMLNILPVALYFIVGVICLVMAFKCFLSKKYLPFHEKAAGKAWNEIENPLKTVILFLLRLSGLGFLIAAVLLMVYPAVDDVLFCRYSIPAVALIFCMGLFVNNYLLFRRTKADTPWKGSLYAMAAIVAGIIVSILNYIMRI